MGDQYTAIVQSNFYNYHILRKSSKLMIFQKSDSDYISKYDIHKGKQTFQAGLSLVVTVDIWTMLLGFDLKSVASTRNQRLLELITETAVVQKCTHVTS